MEKLIVAKIGGNIIDRSAILDTFLADFAAISEKKILVHGGGKIATDIGKQYGIAAKIVEGRRITDHATLKLVTMVYAGLLNKEIVSKLQKNGNNAIGLTGADANVIQANKRPVRDIDYGFVGDIEKVDSNMITIFLNLNMVPVFAPLTHDLKGHLLNTNADTIATTIAKIMSVYFHTELVFCFDQPGILDRDRSVIPKITDEQYQVLKSEGTVSNGMIPKLDNAFSALKSGIKRVLICQAQDLIKILKENKPLGSELILEDANK